MILVLNFFCFPNDGYADYIGIYNGLYVEDT